MNYKKTLIMPRTDFDMRANLTKKEPVKLENWDKVDLYHKMNEVREEDRTFCLHDGPPYANGDIHCGHMLNVLLKDFVVRSKNMQGFNTPYVFGWDTHGLPIEVKIAQSGIDRNKITVPEFRLKCKEYALTQVEKQKSQIHRLGCLGDYENPYITLMPEYEAKEIEVFAAMALKGLIYKGVKPVYWSPSSESALAEAEVEYQDVTAKTMYVYFDFADTKGKLPDDAKVIIWTTTPWTIPADLAVTVNPRFDYGVYETEKGKFLILKSRVEELKETLEFEKCELIQTIKGQELELLELKHPLYDRVSPIIVANFVTDDAGTGFVHTAPDHGLDDFNACSKYGIKPFCPVDEKGFMRLEENDPCNGLFYDDANDVVIKELEDNHHLLKRIDIVHSYPHDWRTHKPVIFRATPQWFASIEPIREQLIEQIHNIDWEPVWGEQKMVNMIKDRGDWCISRQRSWGVPLPIIYNEDGSAILDKEIFDNIAEEFRKHGSNVWWEKDAKEFLPEGYTNEASPNGKFTKELDTMDVWFDSGSSWNGVLKERGMSYPADLYLEGNDQYRGWFNSSLILSTAKTGQCAFKSCLTHGWVMDDKWEKMSKSKGNGIDPSKIANEFGADILRLWASSVNFESDVRISESIIATNADQYRKIRNTFRFMLGNLQDGCKEGTKETVPYTLPETAPELSPIDIWVMSKLETINEGVINAYNSYSFASLMNTLNNFMVELSNFYLDYAKDILYCDNKNSERRKAIQYVLYNLTYTLCLLYNPILPFTMEEVYQSLMHDNTINPQLETFAEVSSKYRDMDVNKVYNEFMKVRDIALKALENERAAGIITKPQTAELDIVVEDEELMSLLSSLDSEELARYFLVSRVVLSKGDENAVSAKLCEGIVCSRCRNIRDNTVEVEEGVHLCARCREALN